MVYSDSVLYPKSKTQHTASHTQENSHRVMTEQQNTDAHNPHYNPDYISFFVCVTLKLIDMHHNNFKNFPNIWNQADNSLSELAHEGKNMNGKSMECSPRPPTNDGGESTSPVLLDNLKVKAPHVCNYNNKELR